MVEYFDVSNLKVGDVINLVWVKSYQHGATMRITKVNPKSFKAEEVKGSYGGPREVGDSLFKKGRAATVWTINKSSNFSLLPNYDDESVDWSDREGCRSFRQFPEHYDWSR